MAGHRQRRGAAGNTGGDPLAVSLVATGSNGASTDPDSFTGVNFGDAATSRKLFFLMSYRAGGGRTVSPVTIGGVTATLMGSSIANSGAQRNFLIWMAEVPTGTSGTIVVNATGNLSEIGWSLIRTTGLVNTTVNSTTGDNIATASVVDVSLNTLASSIVIAGASCENVAVTGIAWSGVTELSDFDYGNSRQHSAAASLIVSASTPLSVTATFDATPNQENSVSINIS